MKRLIYFLGATLLCIIILSSFATYKKFDYATIHSEKDLEGIYLNQNKSISSGFNLWNFDEKVSFDEDDIFKLEFLDSKNLKITYLSNAGWSDLNTFKGKYNKKKNSFDIWLHKSVVPLIIFNAYNFEKVRIGKDASDSLVVNGAKDSFAMIPIFAAGDKYSYINKTSHPKDTIYIPTKENDKWGFADIDGEMKIKGQYDSVKVFKDNVAYTMVGNKWGCINRQGCEILKPIFDSITRFENDLARVVLNGRWGIVDKSGKEVIKPRFDYIVPFTTNLILVRDNNKYGMINKSDSVIIEPLYDNILMSKKDILYIANEGKWGIVDLNGKQITPLKYSNIEDDGLNSAIILFSENEKTGILSASGVELVPAVYDKIISLNGKYGVSVVKGKKGIVSTDGVIVSPIFSYVSFGMRNVIVPTINDGRIIAHVTFNAKEYVVDDSGFMYKIPFTFSDTRKVNLATKTHYTELISE